MANSKLMTPLFHNSSFNRDGRRMRAVHEKTVSNGTDTYRLWRSAGKPDLDYRCGENDKYYLYVEVNGYLAPMGITEYVLIGQSGTMAVDEQYGGREAHKRHFDELREAEGMDAFYAALDEERAEIERLGSDPARQANYIRKRLDNRVQTYLKAKENGGESFPDFVGALVMDDLAKCAELSVAHQAMWREERQAAAVRAAEEDTRKELANAVGLGERTMGKVMQIDEHAPAPIREALDSGELSINQGYNLTRQLRDIPEEQREELAAYAVEMIRAKDEISRADAEAEHRGKIAGLFCKAFERAVLLTPSEENVRLWVEGTRMRPDEIEDSVKEARELSGVFSTIADILERMLPIEVGGEEEQTVRPGR